MYQQHYDHKVYEILIHQTKHTSVNKLRLLIFDYIVLNKPNLK